MSDDGGRQSTESIGQSVADTRQGRQQNPLPTGTPMGQPEQERSDQQSEVFAVGQMLEATAQASLQVTPKQRFLYQCHQQQVVVYPQPCLRRPFW
ncbi:hypothetical protein D3C76_1607040 [compost metagenome]